jgi:hypothetical protein
VNEYGILAERLLTGKTELLFEKLNTVARCRLQSYMDYSGPEAGIVVLSRAIIIIIIIIIISCDLSFFFLVLIRLVLRHSGFKLQIVALPLLCVVPSIDFFFQTVLNACFVLFSDTSLALVIILIAAVTTSTFTYHMR